MSESRVSMPYTLEEIQSCKDISIDDVLKNFDNLNKFDGLTNPKKFAGNNILYNYQYRNLIKCRREGWYTIEQIFNDESLKQKLWVETVSRNRRDKNI